MYKRQTVSISGGELVPHGRFTHKLSGPAPLFGTRPTAVSYTHLDVYKRQVPARDPVAGNLKVLEDAPGSYVKARLDAKKAA